MFSNLKPHVPPLFKEIMSNHEDSARLKSEPVVSFAEAKEAISRKRELARAAEKALEWNTDKGAK